MLAVTTGLCHDDPDDDYTVTDHMCSIGPRPIFAAPHCLVASYRQLVPTQNLNLSLR